MKWSFLFHFRLHFHDGGDGTRHDQIHLNLLFEFRSILNFSFTFGCTSILVLSWRSMWFYFYILCTLNFHFIALCFLICCFGFFFLIFHFYVHLLYKNFRLLLTVLGHHTQVVNLKNPELDLIWRIHSEWGLNKFMIRFMISPQKRKIRIWIFSLKWLIVRQNIDYKVVRLTQVEN